MELRKHYQMMIRGVPTSQEGKEAQGSASDFTEGVREIRGGVEIYAHVYAHVCAHIYAQATQGTSAGKELLTELPESHGDDIKSQICPDQHRHRYDLMSARS